MMKKVLLSCCCSVILFLSASAIAQTKAGSGSEPAELLPADTLVYFTINNFSTMFQGLMDLPIIKAVTGADSDKSLLAMGMDEEGIAGMRETQQSIDEIFRSSEAKQLFGGEISFAFLNNGDNSGDDEYNLASRFVVILDADKTAVLDSYLGKFTDDSGELKMSDITVDGVKLRRYLDPVAVQDFFALPEPGQTEADKASAPVAQEAAKEAPKAQNIDSFYAAAVQGRLVVGTSPKIVAALAKGDGKALTAANNNEFARYQPLWAGIAPAELRDRLFIDIDGLMAFLEKTLPESEEIEAFKKTYTGILSFGGSSMAGKSELKDVYFANITESMLQPSMQYSRYEKKFSLLRPSSQIFFFWARIADGNKILSALQDSIIATEFESADNEAAQEFGLSISELLKAVGPQSALSLGQAAPGSAFPIPTLQMEVEIKDRKVIHKLVEAIINVTIKEMGEDARPKVTTAEDKTMTLTWPAVEAMGMFPLFKITGESVQFSFSGSAVPLKFNESPQLEVAEDLLEMGMVDMNKVADLLTTAYTWGRMMIPPDTDPVLLAAVTDTIEWVRNYGVLTMTFSQQDQNTLVYEAVLKRAGSSGAKQTAPTAQ